MRFLWLCLLAILVSLALASHGYARDFAGVGRLLTNDAFATITDDRWRTGSGALSLVWARNSADSAAPGVGDVLEFRFRGEVITPENIVTPAAGDRPYSAALSFGLHTHFKLRGFETSLGADLVVTGPQTGLPDFQAAIHDLIGVAEPSAAVRAAQIPNGVHGSAELEVARALDLTDRVRVRPFLAIQGGVETLARVGADLQFGTLTRETLQIRDVSTGQRYTVGRPAETGWAAVFGADIAHVTDSLFLPASSGAVLSETRSRIRAGVHWQSKRYGLFYGLTWLSPEFDAQPEGQIVGSLRIDMTF